MGSLSIEVGDSRRRCIKDAHPIILALPTLSFWWQLRGESGEVFGQRYGDYILPIPAIERIYYSRASDESDLNPTLPRFSSQRFVYE